jgi:hypothetical protein
MAGGQEYFMYYSSSNQWWIGGRASMEAEKGGGWMGVDSTALTPNQITETWQVSPPGTGWVEAPKVRARMCSVEEKRTAAERLEQKRQQAMAAARQVGDICVEGQQQGDHQHFLMGVYELMEGKEVNGRGVWQMAGGQEWFMYYDSNKQWTISDRASMEAGEGAGWMSVASTALTPNQVTETWQVVDESVMAYVDAPNVRARMCSAEEKRAAAEKLEQERQQAMAAARQVGDIRMFACIWAYLDVCRATVAK